MSLLPAAAAAAAAASWSSLSFAVVAVVSVASRSLSSATAAAAARQKPRPLLWTRSVAAATTTTITTVQRAAEAAEKEAVRLAGGGGERRTSLRRVRGREGGGGGGGAAFALAATRGPWLSSCPHPSRSLLAAADIVGVGAVFGPDRRSFHVFSAARSSAANRNADAGAKSTSPPDGGDGGADKRDYLARYLDLADYTAGAGTGTGTGKTRRGARRGRKGREAAAPAGLDTETGGVRERGARDADGVDKWNRTPTVTTETRVKDKDRSKPTNEKDDTDGKTSRPIRARARSRARASSHIRHDGAARKDKRKHTHKRSKRRALASWYALIPSHRTMDDGRALFDALFPHLNVRALTLLKNRANCFAYELDSVRTKECVEDIKTTEPGQRDDDGNDNDSEEEEERETEQGDGKNTTENHEKGKSDSSKKKKKTRFFGAAASAAAHKGDADPIIVFVGGSGGGGGDNGDDNHNHNENENQDTGRKLLFNAPDRRKTASERIDKLLLGRVLEGHLWMRPALVDFFFQKLKAKKEKKKKQKKTGNGGGNNCDDDDNNGDDKDFSILAPSFEYLSTPLMATYPPVRIRSGDYKKKREVSMGTPESESEYAPASLPPTSPSTFSSSTFDVDIHALLLSREARMYDDDHVHDNDDNNIIYDDDDGEEMGKPQHGRRRWRFDVRWSRVGSGGKAARERARARRAAMMQGEPGRGGEAGTSGALGGKEEDDDDDDARRRRRWAEEYKQKSEESKWDEARTMAEYLSDRLPPEQYEAVMGWFRDVAARAGGRRLGDASSSSSSSSAPATTTAETERDDADADVDAKMNKKKKEEEWELTMTDNAFILWTELESRASVHSTLVVDELARFFFVDGLPTRTKGDDDDDDHHDDNNQDGDRRFPWHSDLEGGEIRIDHEEDPRLKSAHKERLGMREAFASSFVKAQKSYVALQKGRYDIAVAAKSKEERAVRLSDEEDEDDLDDDDKEEDEDEDEGGGGKEEDAVLPRKLTERVGRSLKMGSPPRGVHVVFDAILLADRGVGGAAVGGGENALALSGEVDGGEGGGSTAGTGIGTGGCVGARIVTDAAASAVDVHDGESKSDDGDGDGRVELAEMSYVHDLDRSIFLENLPVDITVEEVRSIYSRCGPVESVRVYNLRPDLDPGPPRKSHIAALRRKLRLSGEVPPERSRQRRRTPVYARVTFESDAGYRIATCDALRIFGMVVRRHPIRSIPARDVTKLYVESVPPGYCSIDLEYKLSRALRPDVYVCLDMGQNDYSEPRSCEIRFPDGVTAHKAYRVLIDAGMERDGCELHFMRTRRDAMAYWTRKMGFDLT